MPACFETAKTRSKLQVRIAAGQAVATFYERSGNGIIDFAFGRLDKFLAIACPEIPFLPALEGLAPQSLPARQAGACSEFSEASCDYIPALARRHTERDAVNISMQGIFLAACKRTGQRGLDLGLAYRVAIAHFEPRRPGIPISAEYNQQITQGGLFLRTQGLAVASDRAFKGGEFGMVAAACRRNAQRLGKRQTCQKQIAFCPAMLSVREPDQACPVEQG